MSVASARRIALRAQGFGVKDRNTPVNRGHLRRTMRELHLLQLDSVPVIIRTQYMPLFSRLGVYDTSLLDDVAYRRDEWIEAFVHEASLVPAEDEPLFRFFKTRSEQGQTWRGLYELGQREAPYVAEVLREVTERGPLKANELSSPRPQNGDWWSSRSVGSLALDWLFRIGAVGVRRVGNFEKEFDLLDRIVPDPIRAQRTPSEPDAIRELLVRSGQALGVGTAGALVDYFRLPKRVARPLLADVVEDGRLTLVNVEGKSEPVYLHPDAVRARRVDAQALVSPFDPIVWYRDRAAWLFDFDYRIEIYVPKEKRQFGYYVMPFVLGDRIVARCDLKTDRKDGVLRVLSAHLESGVSSDIADPLSDELTKLATLVGVDDVVIDCRGQLADALRVT